MAHANDGIKYLVFAATLMLFFVFGRRELREAIDTFRNNFPRGGPGTPSHPLPADDARLLRRKRRQVR